MKVCERIDASGTLCIAHFSDDDTYRYYLEWSWASRPFLNACLLNPSTATHEVLDPTVNGLIKRAQKWGFGGVVVVNLFAFRATSPSEMKRAANPVGPDNDAVLHRIVNELEPDNTILAGWGNHGRFNGREEAVLKLLGNKISVLGINANRTPKHPLYVSHSALPVPWRSR